MICDREVEEKLRSKCYKTRIEAYEQLKSCWKRGDYVCTHLHPLMARETNIPALEVLLDALEYHNDLGEMLPLLGFLGNSRTSLKKKLRTLAVRIAKKDPAVLCEELVGLCSHKNTKLALNAADMIKELVRSNTLVDVIRVLPILFKHQDAGIRREGLEIALELHKRVGEKIFTVLGDLKPIQLNEIKERCSASKVVPAGSSVMQSNPETSCTRQNVSVSSASARRSRFSASDVASSNRYALPSSSVLKVPTSDEEKSALAYFYSKYPFLGEREWKKRLEGLEENLESVKREDPRVLNTFIYAYKEPVFQISLRLLECASMEERSILCAYCIKKITETKMRDAIYAVLSKLDYGFVISCLIESLDGKNGKVFVETVNALIHLGKTGCEKIKVFVDGCSASGRIEKEAIKRLREEQLVGECEASFSQLSIVPGNVEAKATNERLSEEKRGESASSISAETLCNKTRPHDAEPQRKELISDKMRYPESRNTVYAQSLHANQATASYTDTPCSLSMEVQQTSDTNCIPQDTYNRSNNTVPFQVNESSRTISRFKEGDILLPGVSKMRIKNGKDIEKVFTKEFLRIMREEKPQTVLCELSAVDIISISDFVIKFYLDNHLDIGSLAAYFIEKKYILKDYEIRILLEHLIKSETIMDVDKLYPISKLFIMYQRLMHLNTEFVIQRIDSLIKKYGVFRGDKYGYYNVLKGLGKDEYIGSLIKVCPELLQTANESFLSPVPKRRNDRIAGGMSSDTQNRQEGLDNLGYKMCETSLDSRHSAGLSVSGETKRNFCGSLVSHKRMHKGYTQEQNLNGGMLDTLHLENEEGAPREYQLHPSFEAFVFEERSKRDPRFRSRIEQCRREFEEDVSIGKVPSLIGEDLQKSKEDFISLNSIIDNSVSALLFSANSIISKSLMQLCVARDKENMELFELIVRTLIKLTGCKAFVNELSYKSLHLINVELIKVVRFNSLVGDVLINTCLNTDPLTILSIYLDLVENRSLKEICMKLIWRHSKIRNYIKDPQPILDLIHRFYEKNLYRISEDVVLHKTCQLHLNELVSFYREEIFQFDLKGIVKEYAKNTLTKDADIRKLRESIKKVRDSL